MHCAFVLSLCFAFTSGRRHQHNQPTTTSASILKESSECIKVDDCSCSFVDGSGSINLRSLSSLNNIPKWTVSGNDGWLYKYNPCISFSLGRFSGLAVAFVWFYHYIFSKFYWASGKGSNYKSIISVGQASSRGDSYDLGVQSTTTFNTTSDGKPYVFYIAGDNDRRSRIILECDPHSTEHSLAFVGEIKYNPSLYEFILTTPCACPGYCDDQGLLNSVVITDPYQEIDTNKAINRVELQLHKIENKLKSLSVYQSHAAEDVNRISNTMNKINRRLRNDYSTKEVIDMVEQLERHLVNMTQKQEEKQVYGSMNLVQSSIPPFVALLAHDVLLVVIILLLVPFFISKGRRILQKLLHSEKKAIRKACNCREARLLRNA